MSDAHRRARGRARAAPGWTPRVRTAGRAPRGAREAAGPLATSRRVEEAVRRIAAGKMIIVVDDADRENEGDLVFAAEKATPAMVNFAVTHGRGILCAPMAPEDRRPARLEAHGARRTPRSSARRSRSRSTRARARRPGTSAFDRARRCARSPIRARSERPRAPGPRVPAARRAWRRAAPRRPHRGGARPVPARRPPAGGRGVRDPDRRRAHGAAGRARALRARARARHPHDPRPDRAIAAGARCWCGASSRCRCRRPRAPSSSISTRACSRATITSRS